MNRSHPPPASPPSPPPRPDDFVGPCDNGGQHSPTLVFSPLAWLKLQFFLHAGDTEVGGFGVTSAADLLYVEDFLTLRQEVTAVSVEFDDRAVADYADACVDAGLEPRQFMRVWVHTHPGSSPLPSRTDEETFCRAFGPCDWSVMFILARGGATYARLAFSAGPAGNLVLPVAVDWGRWPHTLIDQIEGLTGRFCDWAAEYAAHVRPKPFALRLAGDGGRGTDQADEAGAGAAPAAGEGYEPAEDPAGDPMLEREFVRWAGDGGPEVPA